LKDSIPWINISDLKGGFNEAFMIYNIKHLPQMILLDKDGIIIDRYQSLHSRIFPAYPHCDPVFQFLFDCPSILH
jgi:hypothetical protein